MVSVLMQEHGIAARKWVRRNAPGPSAKPRWDRVQLRGCYFLAQQSPGPHVDPDLQQSEAQHAPGQHFASGLQQESPLSASADRDDNPKTRTAKSLSFIGNLLSV
jgi:hypothetical protein